MDSVISKELFEQQLERVRGSDLPSYLSWMLLETIYPRLRVRMLHPKGNSREFLLDFSCFDDLPPWIMLVDADGQPILEVAKLPQNGPHFFRYQSPTSPRPSLCYQFAAEYYEWWHLGSINVWHALRNKPEYDMLGILSQIHQLYRNTNG